MGKGTKDLEQLKHLSTKIQKVTSNVVIAEKNEKMSHFRDIRDPRGMFR